MEYEISYINIYNLYHIISVEYYSKWFTFFYHFSLYRSPPHQHTLLNKIRWYRIYSYSYALADNNPFLTCDYYNILKRKQRKTLLQTLFHCAFRHFHRPNTQFRWWMSEFGCVSVLMELRKTARRSTNRIWMEMALDETKGKNERFVTA